MKPTLRQLEYLVAIAETGTFSEAAKRTHVSQPTLSAQVKDMELYLGTPLLERGRHGAILTPTGEKLVPRARIILRDIESVRTIAREASSGFTGFIRLGVLPSVGPYLLPAAAKELHAAYPLLKLGVREERTVDLQAHLSDGRLDVIVSTPEDHPFTESMPIVTENLYICVAPDDPLAGVKDSVSLADIKGRELLSLGYGHKLTVIVKNLADKAGATVGDAYQGTSLDAIRQMSSMGGSIAILPSLYAISEAKKDPDLIVRPIKHAMAKRTISLIWRQTSPLSDKFATIGNVFENVADAIMA
jgi:LysR family hydrogen peroxide-inducible transcriptional activator